MSDLEKFLQQAAERMKERMREQQQAAPRPAQRPKPVRQAERAAPRYEEPEVMDAELVDSPPPRPARMRSEGLSQIDKRKSQVSDGVDQADERMSEHVHQVFDHSLGQLNLKPMTAINDVTPAGSSDQTNRSTEVDRRAHMSSPLTEVLRQSDSLRAAFIVGEIFKRKF